MLWEQFGPPLRGFLARRVPPGVDADDLVQEVFLRVIRGLAALRSTDRPEAWLFQIARNALRDSLRAPSAARRTHGPPGRRPARRRRPSRRPSRGSRASAVLDGDDRPAGRTVSDRDHADVTAGGLAGGRRPPTRRLSLGHEVARAARPSAAASDVGDVLQHRGGRARGRLRLSQARSWGVWRTGGGDRWQVRRCAVRERRRARCVHRHRPSSSGAWPRIDAVRCWRGCHVPSRVVAHIARRYPNRRRVARRGLLRRARTRKHRGVLRPRCRSQGRRGGGLWVRRTSVRARNAGPDTPALLLTYRDVWQRRLAVHGCAIWPSRLD